MNDPLARMRHEHVKFARLLDLLDAQLNALERDEEPAYELMLDIMDYLTHFPDLSHHPREDLAFAKVAERDADVRFLVEELAGEHILLRDSGTLLVQDLEAVVNGTILSRQEVQTPGRFYANHFRSHMQREENELFPRAARLLRPSDWAAIEKTVGTQHDPLSEPAAEGRYEALRRHIGRESAVL